MNKIISVLAPPHDHQPQEPYCNGCGDCCRGMNDEFGVEIQDSDAERIAAFLGLETDNFLQKYTVVEWAEDEDGDDFSVNYLKSHNDDPQRACIFLQDNRCQIHAVKPMQCYLGWPDAEFLQRDNIPNSCIKTYTCLPL